MRARGGGNGAILAAVQERLSDAQPPVARIGGYWILLAIVPLLLAALVAFLYAIYMVGSAVESLVASGHGELTVQLAKVADVVLVGIVLVIVAAGLVELFVPGAAHVRRPWMPEWLAIRSLDDLKEPVLSMLVLIIVITFIDNAVSSENGWQLFGLGVGSGVVIAAVALYRRLH